MRYGALRSFYGVRARNVGWDLLVVFSDDDLVGAAYTSGHSETARLVAEMDVHRCAA